MADVYHEEGDYTLLHGLRHAAFPGDEHPGALVHLAGRVSRTELAVVVYLHGWDNCAENVARPQRGPCPPSKPSEPCADLIGHLQRAGRRALLLVPELRYHARTSDPGQLGRPGALRALLDEVLGRLSGPLTGAGADDVQRVLLFSHSGGYRAAAALVADDQNREPGDDQMGASLLIKRVPTEHSDIPITYFGRLIETSDLPVT